MSCPAGRVTATRARRPLPSRRSCPRRPFAAGDDRAGVSHAPPGGGGAPGDEADNRLGAAALRLVLQKLGGVLFGLTADFPDHHDRLGLGIGHEHGEHVDEFQALDRVAADPDRRRLPEAFARRLEHRFVGERARTRDDADASASEDVARHDADLAFPRGHDAGAIGADQRRLGALQRPLDPGHVKDRNALGDADDERRLGVDRLADRVRGPSRGHVDHAGVGARLLPRFGDRVEDRQPEMDRPAFARRDPAYELRAVSHRLLGMERAVLAGEALSDDLGVSVDEDGHERLSAGGGSVQFDWNGFLHGSGADNSHLAQNRLVDRERDVFHKAPGPQYMCDSSRFPTIFHGLKAVRVHAPSIRSSRRQC